MFDIVIPVGPKDREIIFKQISFTKKNIIGYRNIYIISELPVIHIDGTIFIDENIFPFSITTVADIHTNNERNGWYFQQLIKLYSGNFIPDILDKYLVIDADTFFLKPTAFIHENILTYNYIEYNYQYFKHINAVIPGLKRMSTDLLIKSGVCHHMMFDTNILNHLFKTVQELHGEEFFIVYLKNVKGRHRNGAGASEYELYFNYVTNKFPCNIRMLKWENVTTIDYDNKDDNDFVSCHWYCRDEK